MCVFDCCGDKPPGYDRKPTKAEASAPPHRRPWTEYDANGDKQPKPPYKGLPCHAVLCGGPLMCVFELQWPEWLCNRPSFEPGDCDGWEVHFEVRCCSDSPPDRRSADPPMPLCRRPRRRPVLRRLLSVPD